MNGKLASEIFFWKWILSTEGENDEMGIPNSRDKIAIELLQNVYSSNIWMCVSWHWKISLVLWNDVVERY